VKSGGGCDATQATHARSRHRRLRLLHPDTRNEDRTSTGKNYYSAARFNEVLGGGHLHNLVEVVTKELISKQSNPDGLS
jgi:hypothetical protein